MMRSARRDGEHGAWPEPAAAACGRRTRVREGAGSAGLRSDYAGTSALYAGLRSRNAVIAPLFRGKGVRVRRESTAIPGSEVFFRRDRYPLPRKRGACAAFSDLFTGVGGRFTPKIHLNFGTETERGKKFQPV